MKKKENKDLKRLYKEILGLQANFDIDGKFSYDEHNIGDYLINKILSMVQILIEK